MMSVTYLGADMDENVRTRIFAAADELFAENGKSRPPAVADVRKRAKVDSNDACKAMKEWRLLQGKKAGSISAASLPAELQTSGMNALTAFWQEATNLASDSLMAAQAAWDAERQVNDELCQQLASDFDSQSADLARAREDAAKLAEVVQRHVAELQALRDQLTRTCAERDDAQRALSESMVRTVEARKRADDLEKAAAYAREDLSRARAEVDTLRAEHGEQMERARGEFRRELESERARMERERQRFDELANKATVEAATLRGRLDAIEAMRAEARAPVSRRKRAPNGGAGHDGKN
jgi:DNA repair exonuclease SbcCD ATPase subunit